MRGRHRHLVWIAVFAFFGPGARIGTANPDSPINESIDLPSISARHLRRHEQSDTVLLEATVELSPAGLRVRQDDGRGDLEMLQDFLTERAWLIDRRRRVAHELSLVGRPTASSEADSSFLGRVPCGPDDAVHEGGGRWRGRAVDTYACRDRLGDTTAIELIDRLVGIVVYRRGSNGVVDELHDIRDRTYETGNFTPPSRFRQVDKRELFHGKPALSVFKDSTSD